MIYTSEFLRKARIELTEAWEWYEDRQSGLGDRFKQEVFNCIQIIEQNPEQYPERRKNYREAIVKIFPYLVVYHIHKRRRIIVVVSVFHTSRSSRKKHR